METVLDSLVVRLRADSSGLRRDLGGMQNSLFNLKSLTASTTGVLQEVGEVGRTANNDIAGAAESAIERMSGSLQRLAQSGRLSFGSLRDTALSTFSDIAASALQSGLNSLFSGRKSGGSGGFLAPSFKVSPAVFFPDAPPAGRFFPESRFWLANAGRNCLCQTPKAASFLPAA